MKLIDDTLIQDTTASISVHYKKRPRSGQKLVSRLYVNIISFSALRVFSTLVGFFFLLVFHLFSFYSFFLLQGILDVWSTTSTHLLMMNWINISPRTFHSSDENWKMQLNPLISKRLGTLSNKAC